MKVLAVGLVLMSSSLVPAQSRNFGVCPGVGDVIMINGPALPVAIATDGEVAITRDSLGITTWDVRDPATPREIGSFVGSRGWPPFIARTDFYLHSDGFAIEIPTLGIYDLRHPAHPERSWAIPSPRPNTSFSNYSGDDPWKGIAIRDDGIAAVHAETEIWLLGLVEIPPVAWIIPVWPDLPSRIVDVAFVGDHLVVLGFLGDLVVYDMGDPTAPSVVGTGSLGTPSPDWSIVGGSTVALAVAAPFVSAGSPRGVVVVDLEDPSAPVAHEVTLDLNWWTIGRVELDGDGGVIQSNNPAVGVGWRLNEIDLADPAFPVVTTFTSGGEWDIGLADAFVVRTRSSRIEVLERTVGFPEFGSSPVVGDADDLDVDGSLGVVANGEGGLVVLDVTDPTGPTELSRIQVGGWADEVRLTGTIAVVLVKGQSVVTVDLGDPGNPQILGTLPMTGPAVNTEHLSVDGNRAMVSFGSYGTVGGFLLVDISDPFTPLVSSEQVFAAPATNDTAANLDGAVVLTSNRNNLLTFDVSGVAPVLLDSIDVHPFNEIYSTAVVGDHAFAATGFDLFAVDISDPSSLVVAETYDAIEAAYVGDTGTDWLAIRTVSDGSYLGSFGDLASPILERTPQEMRWWEAGRVMGDVWLRPSGPFLDIVSLECRPPEAEFRWWGLGQPITFENLGRYQMTEWIWDFGDGGVSSSPSNVVSHTYDQPGRYTVTLEVVGPGGADTIAMVVDVGTRIFADDFETGDVIGWDRIEEQPCRRAANPTGRTTRWEPKGVVMLPN